MKLIRFFKTKTFWANVLLAALFIAALLWGISYFMDSYTNHGENIKVPALKKLAMEEASQKLEAQNLNYKVIDSVEYNPEFPRGSVVRQYPEGGALVKSGREIKLTLNPLQPRKIKLPELKEKTKRRAVYDLKSKGFEVGKLEYVPYLGKNVVVKAKQDGQEVEAGTEFEKGTVINLVLGKGLGNKKIKVPYLRWLSEQEAENKLLELSLNKGAVHYDEEVKDSSKALVYRQYPAPTHKPAINVGREVDVWLTSDYTKIPNDSLEFSNQAQKGSVLNDSIH